MNYMKVSFFFSDTDKFTDIITAYLNDIDFESYEPNEQGIDAYIGSVNFSSTRLNQVIQRLKCLLDFDYTVLEVPYFNWNAEWERNFNPILVNDMCIVRSSFHQTSEYEYEVIIDPKMSFGTGHHETTFLIMNYMFNINMLDRNVVDVGCGTGILSILSRLLNSKHTLALDVDECSYKNTLENLRLNNIMDVELVLGTISDLDRIFDVMLVNINRNVILSEIETYFSSLSLGGDLLLTGFLSEDVNLILEKSNSIGFNLVTHNKKNGWSLLHLVK